VETGALLPLTPAVSLRERENGGAASGRSESRVCGGRLRKKAHSGAKGLPLPEGEGRGEGERIVRTVGISKSDLP